MGELPVCGRRAKDLRDSCRERLAACSNTFASIKSAYRWKGAIENKGEIPLLMKTRSDLFEKLANRIRELHPYETPGIVGVEVNYVNEDYRQWVADETTA